MASMAAASSSLVQGAAAAGASFNKSSSQVFVSFNGLKAVAPMSAKQVLRCSARAAWRPVVVTCSSEEATLEECQKIVADQLGVDLKTVTPDSKFSDLGADSLDTVEIVMAMEEKFKIQVEQEGAEKIVTVKDAANVIHQIISQQKA